MIYEAVKIGQIEGRDVYQVVAPLDKQLEAFKKVGISTLATPEDVAQIRLTGLSDDYSRTNIAPIALKGARTILYRDSPLMHPLMAASAVRAHRAHRAGQYFTLGKEVYEEAEALAKSQETLEPEDRIAIIVSQEGDLSLISQMPESRFTLRSQTNDYFEKRTNGKIPFWNLKSNSKDKTIVNYQWFYNPQGESILDCRGRDLGCDSSMAFGVSRTSDAEYQARIAQLESKLLNVRNALA